MFVDADDIIDSRCFAGLSQFLKEEKSDIVLFDHTKEETFPSDNKRLLTQSQNKDIIFDSIVSLEIQSSVALVFSEENYLLIMIFGFLAKHMKTHLHYTSLSMNQKKLLS